MAQTKRKRRSKHRGTAAGTIESRGRTGRRPTGSERAAKPDRKRDRATRFDRPPTWRGAFTRAVLAAAIFFVFVVFAFHEPLSVGFPLAIFTLLIYVPMGYYTDLFIYRRRQKRQAGGKAATKDTRGR
jgi:Flp pilus assembly protein TadB